MVTSHDRTIVGCVVGLYHFRLGWLLGLGSCGKFCINAMVGNDCLCAFHYGAKTPGNVSYVEYGIDYSGFCDGSNGYVH